MGDLQVLVDRVVVADDAKAVRADSDRVVAAVAAVQDQAGRTAGNTDSFYEILKEGPVDRVDVFPIPQKKGRAGLVVYALLLDPAAGESFDREVASFPDVSGFSTEQLSMKPLSGARLEAVPVGEFEPIRLTAGREAAHTIKVHFRS